MNAYGIQRTGFCRIKGQHLSAQNDAYKPTETDMPDHNHNEGRNCEACRQASVASLLGLLWWITAPLRWLMKGKK